MIAGTQWTGTATTATVTVPAGVALTDTGLLSHTSPLATAVTALSWAATRGGVAVSGAVFTKLVQQGASNEYVNLWTVTGVQAGDVITWSGAPSAAYLVTHVYTAYGYGAVGVVGARGGVSSPNTVTGALVVSSGIDVTVWGTERTTASGVNVTGVAVSAGETVTQDYFYEATVQPQTSVYQGHFTPADGSSHTATLTYVSGSGNGLAVLIQQVPPVAPTPSVVVTDALLRAPLAATGHIDVAVGRLSVPAPFVAPVDVAVALLRAPSAGSGTVRVTVARLNAPAYATPSTRVTVARLTAPVSSFTANAGPDQLVEGVDDVTVTGTVAGGTAVSYTWSVVSNDGPAITLGGSGAARTFTAPASFALVTIVLGLVASDGSSLSPQDTVTIRVAPVNHAYLGSDAVWHPQVSRAL